MGDALKYFFNIRTIWGRFSFNKILIGFYARFLVKTVLTSTQRDYSVKKTGDTVMIECQSALGTGGPAKITKITTKYNENTGKPYKILWCGSRGFDAKTGNAITAPFAYFIE